MRMRAWKIHTPGPVHSRPLQLVEVPTPQPGPEEIRIAVSTCGVCRTDLHITEGDLPVHQPHVTPGHEVVGRVDARGKNAERFAIDERVGVPWLRYTCGTCRYCSRGDENLCPSARFTGWDADGGYADYTIAHEQYVYSIPDTFNDEDAAVLLCAGIIGYRALMRTNLPAGGRLGLYGFGGSAHLAAQVAIHQGATVHVMTRQPHARGLALSLGAASAQEVDAPPPEPLDAAIIFAPIGSIIPTALEALDAGGTLVLSGIHMTATPPLDYQHHLFNEKNIRSVTANTRADGEAFLRLAAEIPLQVTTSARRFEDALQALDDLKHGRFDGAAVLHLE